MIHRGGRNVRKGRYWSVVDGTVVELDREGMLPGNRKIIYFRWPKGGAYVVVPVVTLLVVLTLPLTSTLGYMIAWFAPLVIIAAGVLFVCGKLAYYAYYSALEGWEPMKAYFTGKGKGKKK